MPSPKPTSKKRAAILIKAAFHALDDAGGSLPLKDLLAQIEDRVALDEHDLTVYEKTGYVRWRSVLHFYSIDCVEAGFLKKGGGRWYLTPEGRAVKDRPAEEIIHLAVKAYRAWKAARSEGEAEPAEGTIGGDGGEEGKDAATVERSLVFESAQAQARQEIQHYVEALGPYEFQDLVAALLRGMGYHTPYVAPPGPDGGTDVIAYQDPLGTIKPHIRVQVKHRKTAKATREEVAALRGIIRQDREIGLFVSSGGFSADAVREARSGTVHIELIDLDRFLELWESSYDRLTEEDRGLLRLRRVSFLAPE